MSKTMTVTQLRADLYRVIDDVLATGRPCRVVRGDRVVVIGAEEPRKKRRDLSKLKKRDGELRCTFDELVATTWEYRPDPNL